MKSKSKKKQPDQLPFMQRTEVDPLDLYKDVAIQMQEMREKAHPGKDMKEFVNEFGNSYVFYTQLEAGTHMPSLSHLLLLAEFNGYKIKFVKKPRNSSKKDTIKE